LLRILLQNEIEARKVDAVITVVGDQRIKGFKSSLLTQHPGQILLSYKHIKSGKHVA